MACAAVAMIAASSANATVYIAYKYGNGPLTVVASDPTDALWSASVAPNLRVHTALGSTAGYPSVLDSTTVVKYLGGTHPADLDIFMTVDGLTGMQGFFDNGLTENQLVGAWNVTESVFYSATNALFGGTLMASHPFPGPSSTTQTFDSVTNNLTLAGPYSITHQYHIVAPLTGSPVSSAQSTVSTTATAVPEPATWALMLGGFGLAGTMLRSRKSGVKVGYAA
jgi:hypothetical protein